MSHYVDSSALLKRYVDEPSATAGAPDADVQALPQPSSSLTSTAGAPASNGLTDAPSAKVVISW